MATEQSSSAGRRKLFVLDTNVLLHDPNALFNFDEHDVLLSLTVIEELDHLKSSDRTIAHEARAASRRIRRLIEIHTKADERSGRPAGDIDDGIPLNLLDEGIGATGRLYFPALNPDKMIDLKTSSEVNDNLIIQTALSAREDHRFKKKNTEVIVVTKDNNMYIKCSILGVPCDDYTTDRVADEVDTLCGVKHEFGKELWDTPGLEVEAPQGRVPGHCDRFVLRNIQLNVAVNELIVINSDEEPLCGIIREASENHVAFDRLESFQSKLHSFMGITTTSVEQDFALNALLDDRIDIVALSGRAGTGKTLLALIAGLHHGAKFDYQDHIIATRALTPLGEDIGFLPGDEREKVLPWMGAILDNIDFINSVDPMQRKIGSGPQLTQQMMIGAVQFRSLNFIQGRTFHDKFLFIDEAQNLTPSQVKALVARAGKGTKVVLAGDPGQIANKYLDAKSNGLTVLVDRFRGQDNFASMHLTGVVRSRLAAQADELM